MLPLGAWACVCNDQPLDSTTAQRATQIFVFQLVSAEFEPSTGEVVGKIRVIESLKGDPHPQEIRYATSLCCGIRLDVGQFYIGFENTDAHTLAANSGNILDLGESYSPMSPTLRSLKDVLAKKKEWSRAFGEFPNERILALPRPPAPCPQHGE
jgi:hypothetical protein